MTITTERQGQRVYLAGDTYAAKDRIKALGGHWDGDRRAWWVGAAKATQAEALAAELSAPPAAGVGPAGPTMSEHDDRRVLARVKYRGRQWYVIAESRDQGRCLVCLLTGAGRWADMADCELVKTYAPREYRGRKEYTTLGSIRRFVGRRRAAEAQGLPQCAACGKRGELHHDLEDGLQKCFACCDIPE